MFIFVTMDTMAKWIISDHHVAQISWMRFGVATLVFAMLMRRPGSGFRGVVSSKIYWQLARGLCLVASTSLFYVGLLFVPLAEAITLVLTAPFMVAVLSALLLGERVPGYGWVAIMLGFVGALLVIRPGLGIVHWGAVLPLVSGLGFAGVQLISRYLAVGEDPGSTLLITALVGAVILTPFGLALWQPPTLTALGLLVMIGVLAAIADGLLLRAFRSASASALAPFQYTQILWAGVFGFVVFREIPDAPAFGGAMLILLSGVYLLSRNVREADPTV